MISTTVTAAVQVDRERFWHWFVPVDLSTVFAGHGRQRAVAGTSGQTGS